MHYILTRKNVFKDSTLISNGPYTFVTGQYSRKVYPVDLIWKTVGDRWGTNRTEQDQHSPDYEKQQHWPDVITDVQRGDARKSDGCTWAVRIRHHKHIDVIFRVSLEFSVTLRNDRK